MEAHPFLIIIFLNLLLPSAPFSPVSSSHPILYLPDTDAILSTPSRIRYTAATYPMNRMVIKVRTGLNTIRIPRASPAMFTVNENQ